MSKKIIFLLYCFLFIGITMQASATSSKLTEIVSAVERAVDVVPDGSYVVTIFAGMETQMVKVDSAADAIAVKDVALAKGATKVHIRSKYPTIYRDCNNDYYYPDGSHSDGEDITRGRY